jgi:hypothetical protein
MLDPRHTRRSETPSRARKTLQVIQLVIDNSRSFSTADLQEINQQRQEQEAYLEYFNSISADDSARCEYVFTERVGCGLTIDFRRSIRDFNTLQYVCGEGAEDTPHVCCICEAILSIHRRRQLRQLDIEVQNSGYREEELLVAYRNFGIIRTRYLGQYVELERHRQLQLLQDQFAAFRNLAQPRSTASSEPPT